MRINLKNLADEEIVVLVRNKNRDWYEELVNRYQDKLIRYATYIIRDRNSASDIVQESFIKAFVNLKGFDKNKKFSSWIYRIVHNEAVNFVKKNKKEIFFDDWERLEKISGGNADFVEKFDREEMAKMLKSCLNETSLKYSSPLSLFYFEEKGYGEISDILRIPVSTVGTRIARGKKIIRNICEKKGIRKLLSIKNELKMK